MKKSPFYFNFKPADESQRPLIHGWLEQGYIREWVHGQGLQNLLLGLEKFFQQAAQNKGIDRQTEITQHWIGYEGDRPFVYLLTSHVIKDTSNEYAKYSETEGFAITLDIFICDTEYLGKGLAGVVIKEFLLSQCSEVAEIFIDPEQTNRRAVHVYQKAGFRIVGEFIAAWHPVPHFIMKLDMKGLLLEQKLSELSILIRPFKNEDLDFCIALFQETVHAVNAKDYTLKQLHAWAPQVEPNTIDNYSYWKTLKNNISYVAHYKYKIVGFGDLAEQGYLDRLFVHKDFQGRGIATAIVKKLEHRAKELALKEITTHASITAKPFFESAGFIIVREQQVEVRGEKLTNFLMKKILTHL